MWHEAGTPVVGAVNSRTGGMTMACCSKPKKAAAKEKAPDKKK
jgi:hypothetical protein